MAKTIGIVANIYNEANAITGWLESAAKFADHISVYHAGPNGAKSDDGTIEILEKWKIPITYGSIDEGFGPVRTKTVRTSPCDYVILLDADERFDAIAQVLGCHGESTPREEVNQLLYDYSNPNYVDSQVIQPYDAKIDFTACPSNFENMAKLGANLTVSYGEVYTQGAWVRDIIEKHDYDAIKSIRRHWHDFSMKRPTQNWHTEPDFQMRIVKNVDSVYFGGRMHEGLHGAPNHYQPNFTHGPFLDHFHLFFKKLEPTQRKHDIAIYNSINEGRTPPSFEEFVRSQERK